MIFLGESKDILMRNKYTLGRNEGEGHWLEEGRVIIFCIVDRLVCLFILSKSNAMGGLLINYGNIL